MARSLPENRMLGGDPQDIHRESKKGATLTMAITLSVLGHLQNSFTAAKSSKFPTKLILGYPPHLKYVAALPWKT